MKMSERNFLITGATGFVGGAVAVSALRAGHGRKLLLMARASAEGSPVERVLENLRRLGASEHELQSLGTDFILNADLGAERAFIDQPRLGEVERVVHAAALPTFSHNPNIRAVNVEGTLALARTLNLAVLKRFVFVGTAMAVGPSRTRGSLIQESHELGADEDHLVPYTASKAEAERRLRQEFPELPLVVARPSIVVGHTQLGVKPSQSIFWVFLVGHMLGAFTCDLADFIDVVPADWCAHVLLELATRDSLEHDVYHISAGRESSVTIRDLDQVLAQARRVSPIAPTYRKIGKSEIPQIFSKIREIVPGASRRLLKRALELYGGFAELNYVFDNSRIQREGLRAAPPFTSYLPLCVETAHGIPIARQMQWDFK